MTNVARSVSVAIAIALLGAAACPAFAQTPPAAARPAGPSAKIEWSAQDVAGNAVKVPAADRATVVLFAMADQPQSQDAMAKAKAVLAGAKGPAVQALLVLTGAGAEAAAAKLAKDGAWPWPIVIDKDYAASGKMSVHVWPTTLAISATGEQLAHLAGLPRSYSKQLESYLAFATGQIDRAQLEQQLAAHQVVIDTPAQMAGRHLQVAERLLAKGLVEEARAELTKGLQLQPNDPKLQLTMVRVLLLMGQSEGALTALEKVDASAVPAWQVELLRGRVLMALGKWEQARVVLIAAARLNPQPAEAYYALGLVYQHQNDWPHAAESFRQAFENTDTGREIAAPASQPGS